MNQTLAITTGYFYVLSVLCLFNLVCIKDVLNQVHLSRKRLIRHILVSLLSPLCWPIIFAVLLRHEIRMRKAANDLRNMLNQMFDKNMNCIKEDY